MKEVISIIKADKMEEVKSYLEAEISHYDSELEKSSDEVKQARRDYGRDSSVYEARCCERRILSSVRQRLFQQLMDLS